MHFLNGVSLVIVAVGALALIALTGAWWRANRRAAALEAAIEHLRRELETARERFRLALSGAAHNLSQPMTTLHGTLELALRSPALSAASRPALEDALEQVRSAAGMTRLLREFSETDLSGKLAQPISLDSLLESMREDLQHLAEGRGVRFLLEGRVRTPVFASLAELRRAIQYVAEHALERSPSGGLVQITAAREDDAASVVISDQGPSLSPQDLTRCFEPFHSRHGGEAAKRDALRLAIAERTCAAFRGSAAVANQEGGGARFILRLSLI